MRSVFARVSPSLAEAERGRISTELASALDSTLARVRQGGADRDTVLLVVQVCVILSHDTVLLVVQVCVTLSHDTVVLVVWVWVCITLSHDTVLLVL